MNSNKFDISYIDIGYVWSREFMDSFMSTLNRFEEENREKTAEKIFVDMKIEIINAYREFQTKIKDLPLIMKCRVKCDKDSNFGGLQCATFASKMEYSITKYINNFDFADIVNIQEDSLVYGLKQIKDKAHNDKIYAYDCEKETKEKYLTLGRDDTLEIFKKSGYNVN